MNRCLNSLVFFCLPFLLIGQEQVPAKDPDPDKLVFRASLLAGVSNSPNFDESNERHYFNPQGGYLGLVFSLGKENIGLSASYFASVFSYSESKIKAEYPNYSTRNRQAKITSSGVFIGPYLGNSFGRNNRLALECSAGFGFISENRDGKAIKNTTGLIDREDDHLMVMAYLIRAQSRYLFRRPNLSAGIGTDFIYFNDYENGKSGVITPNFYGLIMVPF